MKKVALWERVAFLEGVNLVVIYYISTSEIGPDKRVASPEGDKSVVIYYLSTSEYWPDTRRGL